MSEGQGTGQEQSASAQAPSTAAAAAADSDDEAIVEVLRKKADDVEVVSKNASKEKDELSVLTSAHIFVDGRCTFEKKGPNMYNMRCLLKNKNGHPCTKEWTGNCKQTRRVATHFIGDHDETIESLLRVPKTKGMRQLVLDVRKPTATGPTPDELQRRFLIALARTGLSFVASQDWALQSILIEGASIHRNYIGTRMQDEAARIRAVALQHFSTPTVCIDVGTVRRRYCLVTLVERDRAIVVDSICDEEFEDQRMTIANLRPAVQRVVEMLHDHNVYPVAVTADNCANMQGLRTRARERERPIIRADGEDEDDDNHVVVERRAMPVELLQDELQELDPEVNQLQAAIEEAQAHDPLAFLLRCAAHCVMLTVTDVKATWDAALGFAMEVRDTFPRLGTGIGKLMGPKWSSALDAMEALLKIEHRGEPVAAIWLYIESCPDHLASVRRAVAGLRPLLNAVYFIQSDEATLFDTLCMADRLLTVEYPEHIPEDELERDPELAELKSEVRASLLNRLPVLFDSPLYQFLVYFMPSTNLQADDDVISHVESITEDVFARLDPRTEREWNNFLAETPRAPTPGSVTREEYTKHVEEVCKHYPHMLHIIRVVMSAAPSEASVERGFSVLKGIVKPTRSRLGHENVTATLIVSSCSEFLGPKASYAASASPEPRRVNDGSSRQTAVAVDVLEAPRTRNERSTAARQWATKAGSVSLRKVVFPTAEALAPPELDDEPVARRTRYRGTTKQLYKCDKCRKDLDKHTVIRQYVECSSCKKKDASNVRLINLKCLGHPTRRIKTDLSLLQPCPNVKWECDTCAPAT